VATIRNLQSAAHQSGISKSRSLTFRQSLGQHSPQPPPQALSNVPAPSVVEPVTPAPAIQVEADQPNAVAASMPIHTIPHDPVAPGSAQVLPALAKLSGRAGWPGFSDQPRQFASKYCNEGCPMGGRDGTEFYFLHKSLCFKKANQAIEMATKEKPNVTAKSC